ncbi:MAG: T9SS type A sorting domain-containing protein [Reichenbachiella sp.]|uniref:T9SS type A sorting domain-containing protein n=1 Tax=Reichenbachiella sp. TaxID=2184521 RepID=UPI0032991641
MMRISQFLLIQILLTQSLCAQVELEIIQPFAIKNNQTLELAFTGGINSAQYHTIDLDGDGDLDLVLFDRSADKINCFENTGTAYIYQPYFEFLFPENIQHWMILADYDCDGFKDLFTYTGQGIRVFRNISSNNSVSWELVAEPLKTLGSSSKINLLFNPTDIPSIADLDNDGDLDILGFDFASSSQIEFHKNHSVENEGSCGLDFVRETRSYGDIWDCGCDNFTIDEPCSSSGRILHAGGKALLSLDYNSDGLMDLVLSQETCENLSYAENNGSLNSPSFASFDNAFPLFSSNLNFTSFPTGGYEDVTFDGQKDLIVSSNVRSNTFREIDFKSSSLLFENSESSSNQFENSIPFLQDQMIDVGEHAYPAIADIDGDGNNDLIIGNVGSLNNNDFISSLTYYRSTQSGLEWVTDDLYDLSTLGLTELKPQFVDINGDQKLDLVFSALDESFRSTLFYIRNNGSTLETLELSQLQFIEFNFSRLDDFTLDYINDDDLPDLLLGISNGRLDYYINTGTSTHPMFTLETEGFLNIVADGDKSNLSVATGAIDDIDGTDLITTDRTGKMLIYSDFHSGNSVPQESIIKLNSSSVLVSTRFGRISKPAFGELLGRVVIAVGSIQGGLRLLSTSTAEDENKLSITAFPVPTLSDRIVNFQSNMADTRLEIYSLTGHKVAEVFLTAHIKTSLDLGFLQDGLYLAKATSGNQSCTVKIVVSPF